MRAGQPERAFLQQFNICIVFPLIGEEFFFGENPAHQVFIEFCLETLNLRHFNYQDEYQKAVSLAEQIAVQGKERKVG